VERFSKEAEWSQSCRCGFIGTVISLFKWAVEMDRLDRNPHQVEIPRKPIHRQFNVHVGQSRKCHRRVQGRHPLQTSDALGAAAAQLGPDAQAAVV
jgi:hypothetical protein